MVLAHLYKRPRRSLLYEETSLPALRQSRYARHILQGLPARAASACQEHQARQAHLVRELQERKAAQRLEGDGTGGGRAASIGRIINVQR